VTAHQEGNATYAPAPDVAQTFTVTKATQAIAFGGLPDKVIGEPPFVVSATATSGLPVTFTVSGGTCSIAGNMITLIKAGACAVTAQQAGNANYKPASSVVRSFVIHGNNVYLPLISAHH
jgi:hypothetical protein